MKRTSRNNITNLKPVEKVELDESNVKRRLILTVLALAVAGVAIGYGISTLTSSSKGWNTIEVNSSAQLNSGSEFTFSYYLGKNGSPTAERKALSLLYTEACEQAYADFDDYNIYEGINNIRYINEHPNQKIQVSDYLYASLSKMVGKGGRYLYLGPLYEIYCNVLYTDNDTSAELYDVYYSEEYRDFAQQLLSYINNSENVELELLGNNTISLNISQEYYDYCKANGVKSLISFSWLRNAFIIDFLAERIMSAGYNNGNLASNDGYAINFGGQETIFNLFDWSSNNIFQAGSMAIKEKENIINLKSFPLTREDNDYYIYQDGIIRTAHISNNDIYNIDRHPESLIAYSKDVACADIVIEIMADYLNKDFNYSDFGKYVSKGIQSIYIKDKTISFTEKGQVIDYDKDNYTIEHFE